MPDLLIGVDGGNSKTLAVVADTNGAVLGVGRAGSGSHQGLGLDGALREIRAAIAGAWEHVADGGNKFARAASFCLAGADLPEDFALLEPALAALGVADTVDLHNDTMAALRCGTERDDAVAVILGAGTNAIGRNAEGQEIRLPGLGWESGDWGGGGELAREAVRATARAFDGRGPHTPLADRVLEAFGVPDGDALIRRLYLGSAEENRRDLHRLPPLVFESATQGDPIARGLLLESGEEVATTAVALMRRLGILDRPADVVLAGSVFRNRETLLIDTVRSRLAERAPLARIVLPRGEPVLGALYCAFDLVGIPSDGDIRQRAEETYKTMVGYSVHGQQSTVHAP